MTGPTRVVTGWRERAGPASRATPYQGGTAMTTTDTDSGALISEKVAGGILP